MGGGTSKVAKRLSTPSTSVDGKALRMPFALSRDHVQTVFTGLMSFQKDGKHCDVQLVVKDKLTEETKSYRGHKCVLAASSRYCKDILDSRAKNEENSDDATKPTSPEGSPSMDEMTLAIPVSVKAMDKVMNFLYTADVEAHIREIPDLLEAAVRLEIPSLKKYCAWALRKGYILEFFRPILKLSEDLGLSEIREFVLRRTVQCFDDFVDTNAFLQLNEKEMQILVDSRRGCLSDGIIIPEVEMFNSILKWEKQNHAEREESARKLLRHLHYREIPKTTLSGYIVTHELVNGDSELKKSIEEVLGHGKKLPNRLRRKSHTESFLRGEGDVGKEVTSPTSSDGSIFDIESSLLVCGGRLFDQMSAKMLLYNEKLNSWHEISRLPTVLSHHGVAAVGNALYLAGGEDSSISGCHSIGNLWRYDPPPKNEWTHLSYMQHSRSNFFFTSFNKSLYAIGGRSGKIVRNSVEKYTIALKKWEFVSSLKSPRFGHAGCTHKNMIYVSGGVVGKHSTVDMIRFDPIVNHWSTMSSMRCSRSKHCMAPVRDRIYVIGGEDDSLGATRPSCVSIECYTPEYDQWHNVAIKMPVQSDGEYGYSELNGRIFVVGGCKSQLAEHRAEVFCYEPEGDQWEIKAKLPRRLRGAACVAMSIPY